MKEENNHPKDKRNNEKTSTVSAKTGNKKNTKRKKKKKMSTFKKVLLILLAIILILAGVFAFKVIRNGGGLQGFLSAIVGHDEQTLKNLPKTYVLVMGVSKDTGAELTDTLMLCSYDPKTQEASMLSIPRDTFVGKNKAKATASDKINALYNISKDPMKTLAAVEKLTGIDIPYYVVIDNDAVIELVDAIGGVDFDVPIDMDYDDVTQDLSIRLKAGMQKINGEKAEQLLRFRHNNDGSTYPAEYGQQDIGRMRTQREFITATLKQTLKPENIFKLGQILEVVQKNVKTNMTLSEMKDYLPYAVNFSTEKLKTGIVPGTPEMCNKVSVYIVDKEGLQTVLDELFSSNEEENGKTTEENTTKNQTTNNTIDSNTENKSKSDIRIEILNGSNKTTNLSNLTKYLKGKGYNVVKTGNNSNAVSKTSIINRTNNSTETSKELKQAVGVGSITTGTKTQSNVDYTIIIGKDYKAK